MDEIVRAAMDKWPNVPHCYAWLALDARGNWRMRDERTQALNLAGDKIRNSTLLGFINRNYGHDEGGNWYFQNGPQRVYVDLESAPYIARTTPEDGLILHTGETMPPIDSAFLSAEGRMFLRSGAILAQLDDRDVAQCLSQPQLNGKPVSDEELLHWLENENNGALSLSLVPFKQGRVHVQHAELDALMAQAGFTSKPRAG